MKEVGQQPKDESLAGYDPKDHAKFPIFLLGTGRCGSTLVQKILNSVEEVMIYGEHGGFLRQIAEAYFLNLEDKKIAKYILSQNVVGEDATSVTESLKNPQRWTAWTNWYNRETVKKNFRDFIESFFNPITLGRKMHWGFKEIRYGIDDRVLEMLADLYPQGRIIFVVRNPVDVVASKISARMSAGIEADAHSWTEQNSHFLEFYRLNKKSSRIVRYEDLINDNGPHLDQLFNWLGFSLTDRQINIIEITRPSYHGRPRPVKLTAGQINEINKMTKGLRKELDY
ncbi:MAG: sulfotransferase [Deltaproteobacteria bacterium]|nr:sulfotransferase [Deltaproteobacteria bacterium]